MSQFSIAIPFVLAHEGGFTESPTGEVVNRGINTDTLHALGYIGDKAALTEIVRNLTLAETEAIYKQQYWTFKNPSIPDALDQVVSQAVANKILDMAVLSGQTTAIKLLQKAVGLIADGHFGPGTLVAANTFGDALIPPLIQVWSASLTAIADRKIAGAATAKDTALTAYWTRVKQGWLVRAAWNGA